MMNQYKNETAQIHAPAALVERTRSAVRQEEERLRKEQAGRVPEPALAPAPQAAYVDDRAYETKRSLQKWTYPLTVAAAIVLLLSVSVAVKGIRSGDFRGNAKDGAMMTQEAAGGDDTCAGAAEEMYDSVTAETGDIRASGNLTEGADNTEAAGDLAAATEDAEGAGGLTGGTDAAVAADDWTEGTDAIGAAGGLAEEMDHIGATDGAADTEAKEMERGEEAMEQTPAADAAADRAASQKKEAVQSFRHVKDDSVEIEEVDKKPGFCDHADARDVDHEGLTFRVIKEDKGWAAYVEVAGGKAYVIRAEAESLEDFIDQAYKRLVEESVSNESKS